MKRCRACSEAFEDKFSFCPVDGSPLNWLAEVLSCGASANRDPEPRRKTPGVEKIADECVRPVLPEYRITMLDNTALVQRLTRELSGAIHQLKQSWPALRRDPIAFGRARVNELSQSLGRLFLTPHSFASITMAVLVIASLAIVLVMTGTSSPSETRNKRGHEESSQIVILNFPYSIAAPTGRGIGVGSTGRVGLSDGKGEGSDPKRRKSGGGGGGGQLDRLPSQRGKAPQASSIPAPIPKRPPSGQAVLPVAGIDIDPLLWKNLPMPNYGDPRSNYSIASNGPGNDGGMGTANGTGIGEGNGPGFGPGTNGGIGGGPRSPGGGRDGGSDGNNPHDVDRVYAPRQTTGRVLVLSKPEPQYTEEARRNQITGTVVLRAVFSRAGEVINIRAIQSLPLGLTERAIIAARRIKFQPATIQGRPVNVHMQLEYNFNLY